MPGRDVLPTSGLTATNTASGMCFVLKSSNSSTQRHALHATGMYQHFSRSSPCIRRGLNTCSLSTDDTAFTGSRQSMGEQPYGKILHWPTCCRLPGHLSQPFHPCRPCSVMSRMPQSRHPMVSSPLRTVRRKLAITCCLAVK